jgi:hypothetical protein
MKVGVMILFQTLGYILIKVKSMFLLMLKGHNSRFTEYLP